MLNIDTLTQVTDFSKGEFGKRFRLYVNNTENQKQTLIKVIDQIRSSENAKGYFFFKESRLNNKELFFVALFGKHMLFFDQLELNCARQHRQTEVEALIDHIKVDDSKLYFNYDQLVLDDEDMNTMSIDELHDWLDFESCTQGLNEDKFKKAIKYFQY